MRTFPWMPSISRSCFSMDHLICHTFSSSLPLLLMKQLNPDRARDSKALALGKRWLEVENPNRTSKSCFWNSSLKHIDFAVYCYVCFAWCWCPKSSGARTKKELAARSGITYNTYIMPGYTFTTMMITLSNDSHCSVKQFRARSLHPLSRDMKQIEKDIERTCLSKGIEISTLSNFSTYLVTIRSPCGSTSILQGGTKYRQGDVCVSTTACLLSCFWNILFVATMSFTLCCPS